MAALDLPARRRQDLLLEFASLKHIRLRGVYVSLTSSDVSKWAGVVFVRKVYRFRIAFPDAYPHAAPVITFNTDVFHPLVTPLTTYTYSGPPSDALLSDASLPPGALSLRHGFPFWYVIKDDSTGGTTRSADDVVVADVLRYIRTCLEDEAVLDSIPLEAAANPSAWYAWQAHRPNSKSRPATTADATQSSKTAQDKKTSPEPPQTPNKAPNAPAATSTPKAKGPADWNWEGVWDDRVKRTVQASLADAALYGSAKDDEIQFVPTDEALREAMAAELSKLAAAKA